MQLALGLIETKGLVGAIEAADAMAKAAEIKIINKEKITAALVTIEITGEVAAVRAALDAGAAAAQRVGQLIAVHLIPRPDDQLDHILDQSPAAPENQDQSLENMTGKSPGSLEDDENESDLSSDEPDENGEMENADIEQVDISQINLNEIGNMNVHKLRRLARGTKDFPIKGRDISKANRQVLIDLFWSMMQ